VDGWDCIEEEGEEDWRERKGFKEEKGDKLKGPSAKETKFDWEKKNEAAVADISPLISLFFPFFSFTV
jgi:hypothetical protein